MSVVANVAINVDSRDAAAKLRQFQQQSTAAGRAAEQLQHGTTAAGQAAQGAGRQFQTAANGLKYYIDATGRARKENGQFVSAAEAAAAGLKLQARAGDEAGRSMSKLEGIMKQLGLAIGAAGVGRFAAGLTRTAATFEGELRKAAAIEGGGNFNQLRQDVERVAAAAAGTPTQVAALATSLSRAGFTAAETGQSLQGIVRGAEATAISFEQMGSIAADTMRSFGIETSKTQEVVDILVKTANSSNQTITAVGETMSYAASTAKSLGINIEDLSIATALLADTGIRGSRAGTTLSTGLSRLQRAASGSAGDLLELGRGNEMLSKSMKALGVDVLDVQGRMKPLDQVIVSLKRNFDKMDVGKRTQIANALFGEDAGRGWLSLLNNSESKIESIAEKIRNAKGAAASTQKEMQGFSYSMEVLGGNVEIVSNAIGDKFITVLQPMVNGLNAALAEAQKLPKPLRDVAAGAAAVGIAVGGMTLAMKTLIPVVTTLAGLMGIGGLGGLIAAGPWIALAAGVAAAAYQIYQAANAQQQLNDQIAFAPITEVNQKIIQLQNELAGAEEKLLQTQGQFGALSREAVLAEAKVDALRGALEQVQGDYRIRLLYQEVGVTPVSGYYGPGFKAPKQEAKPKPTAAMDRVPAPVKTTGGRGGTDKAAREAAQLQSRLRGLQMETQGTLQLALIKGKIAEAEMAGNKELAIRLQGEQRNQQILLGLQRSLEGVTDERERQALITKAQAELESAGIDTAIEMERRRLEVIKEQNDELFKRAGFTPQDKMGKGAGAFDPSLPDLRVSPAEQQMAAYREELAALTNPINMAVTGADAIGNAFGQAFQDIATGAKSTQEALADAFKGIGEAFIQMATQIIAKQLAMIAFQAILKALGGGGGFSFSGAGPAQLPSGPGFAEGFNLPELFADGGFVTGPTSAVVGEGGEPEYVIPASKMRTAMARYSSGARGSAVIPGNGDEPAASGGGVATAAPIDVRYSVERINNVDYVTADQFQRGMAQAAEQGAKRGEQRALYSLRQNTNIRRSVGV